MKFADCSRIRRLKPKEKVKKIKKIISGVLLGHMFLLAMNSVSAFAPDYSDYIQSERAAFSSNIGALEVQARDSIAGVSTSLRASTVEPYKKLIFELVTPSGENHKFLVDSGYSGSAKIELEQYYTRVAGKYLVNIYDAENLKKGKSSSFIVYPGSVSVNKSEIAPADQVVNSSNDSAVIKVKLSDDFGNPIEGHVIKLLSSNPNSNIQLNSNSNKTNANGEVSFRVSSVDGGAVTYTAYDLSSDLVLNGRARVAYFDSNYSVFLSSNDFDSRYAASGNASNVVDSLKFDNFPDVVEPGESISFALGAYDQNDQLVPNYTGRVRFTALGSNSSQVNLPGDFQFTADDQGEHTFSLALYFQQPGSYQIEARDLDNNAIFGVETVSVIQSSNVNDDFESVDDGIQLSSPMPGTYSNNVQVISGVAEPAARLKIFDNNVELANLIADFEGRFTYTTTSLGDGVHNLSVASVNEVGTVIDTSRSIEVIIDTSSPEISQVVIQPQGVVDAGTPVSVQLEIQDALSQASVVFADNIYSLEEVTPNVYQTNFLAPSEAGAYPMDFILVDELGNESRVQAAATLNVGGMVAGEGSNDKISPVRNLVATPNDGRVILNWDVPLNFVDPIQNYRVFYGASPNELTSAVDTFTNSTTWYIPNLPNGTEFYFAVLAVDTLGDTSSVFSNIVSSTPAVQEQVVEDVPDPEEQDLEAAEALEDLEEDVSDSGPEFWIVVAISLAGGFFYSQTIGRRRELEVVYSSYDEINSYREEVREGLNDLFS